MFQQNKKPIKKMLLNFLDCHCHPGSNSEAKRSWHPSRWLTLTALMALLLTVQQATAQQRTIAQQTAAAIAAGDTFRVTAGSNLQFDSNVFRLSPSIDPLALVGQPTRSDRIIISTATLNFNKLYSLQRFEGHASIVDNRYNNFNFLDFTAFNYGGAWRWNLTPYLYGNLSGSHEQGLNNFANMTGFLNSNQRVLRTSDNLNFDAVYEIDGAWRIIGGISQSTVKNSRAFLQDTSFRMSSAEGGIRYAFPSGSSLTYKFRTGLGKFLGREFSADSLFDNRFTEMEHDIRLIWPVTGKTSINARVGHLERKHPHFSQRDFSGLIGNFDFNWDITGNTRLTASWARTLGIFQTALNNAGLLSNFQPFSSSYMAIDRFSLEPVWQISANTALRLRYDYSMMDFLGAVSAIPSGNRSDIMHSGVITLDWQPVNAFFLSASLQHDRRTSNFTGYDFNRSAASVNARINF